MMSSLNAWRVGLVLLLTLVLGLLRRRLRRVCLVKRGIFILLIAPVRRMRNIAVLVMVRRLIVRVRLKCNWRITFGGLRLRCLARYRVVTFAAVCRSRLFGMR